MSSHYVNNWVLNPAGGYCTEKYVSLIAFGYVNISFAFYNIDV